MAYNVEAEILRLSDEQSRLRDEFRSHKESQESIINKILDWMNEIRNDLAHRPPVWVTTVVSVMAAIIGLLSGLVVALYNVVQRLM